MHISMSEIGRENGEDRERVIVTGHSMGGALALICSYDLQSFQNMVTYVFSTPKVGDRNFIEEISRRGNVFSFVLDGDLIPRLPLSIFEGYYPSGLFVGDHVERIVIESKVGQHSIQHFIHKESMRRQ